MKIINFLLDKLANNTSAIGLPSKFMLRISYQTTFLESKIKAFNLINSEDKQREIYNDFSNKTYIVIQDFQHQLDKLAKLEAASHDRVLDKIVENLKILNEEISFIYKKHEVMVSFPTTLMINLLYPWLLNRQSTMQTSYDAKVSADTNKLSVKEEVATQDIGHKEIRFMRVIFDTATQETKYEEVDLPSYPPNMEEPLLVPESYSRLS